MNKLLKFKKELIKEIKIEDSKWYCRLCKRLLPSGDYCMERHFKKCHKNIEPIYKDEYEEKEWNWSLKDIDLKRIVKCINKVYKNLGRRRPKHKQN